MTSLLTEPVVVRVAGPADAEALLALHHAGFDSGWDLAQWRWRYVDNPLGRTEIVGAFTPDGRCVASFCGVPLPCDFAGERALAQRAGDVLVHPRLRSGMAGSQLLHRTAHAFFAAFGGGATRLVFGFPEPGLCRTIVRHHRFEVLADVAVLTREVAAGTGDVAGPVLAHVPDGVDALHAAARPRGASGLVRDGRYLQWRYEHNPHARYGFVVVRDAHGALAGLAVVRDGGLYPGALAVLEWLVRGAEPDVAAALLAAVDGAARQAQAASVVVSVATSSPEFAWFQQAAGCRVLVTPYQLLFRSWASGITRRSLLARWQHSLGDMDFT